jgi:succinate dehydrogenase / fumarate reductase cytochrome b subunit
MPTAAPATQAIDEVDSPSRRDARAAFIRSRLASFFGLAPLGVWVVVHLWNNLAAFEGPDAWQAAVTQFPHPFAQAVTGIVVLVPLGIHAAWGVGRLFASRPNNLRYPTYANLKYVLQRLSAVGVLLFVGAHVWKALLEPRLVLGRAEDFADLAQTIHFHRPTFVVYVFGTLGVAYHLANGALTSCMAWGVVTSRRGLQRLEWAALAFFVVLLAMSWGAVYALWAAGAPAH